MLRRRARRLFNLTLFLICIIISLMVYNTHYITLYMFVPTVLLVFVAIEISDKNRKI